MLHKLYTGVDYVLYLLKANTLHGTHSPFVYRWAEAVLYGKNRHSNHRVELARSWALSSKKTAPVSPSLSLRQWTLKHEPTAKYGRLLQRHLVQFNTQRIILYGVGLGILPCYALELPQENQPQVHLYLENPEWQPFLETTMQTVSSPVQSWVLHNDPNDGLQWAVDDLIAIDALWLIQQDKEKWFAQWDALSSAPHSVWIYNVQANEQTRLWTTWLKNQAALGISVDLFWTMCLFSRPDQAPEQFTLRY